MKKTYFDILPSETLEHIAKFLKNSESNEVALDFAYESESRRCAVMKGFNHDLELLEGEGLIYSELLHTFGDLLHSVNMKKAKSFCLRDAPCLHHLRKASITANEVQLGIIRYNRYMKSLDVTITEGTDAQLLRSTLQTFPRLRVLNLNICENSRIGISRNGQVKLAQACRNVTHLTLSGNENSVACWTFARSLPYLQKISIAQNPGHESCVSFLKKLDVVEITGGFTVAEAARVGKAVTKLIVPKTLHEAGETNSLRNLPKLRELKMAIEDGAEVALLGKIENLESLTLRWDNANFWHEERENILLGDGETFYVPEQAMLLDLLRGCSKLRELSLEYCIVHVSVLERTFEEVGDRLEKFSFDLSGQDEHSAFRMARILNSLAQNCPNLEVLHLMEADNRTHATEYEKRECLVALNNIRRKCPKLTGTKKIREYIDAFELRASKTRNGGSRGMRNPMNSRPMPVFYARDPWMPVRTNRFG